MTPVVGYMGGKRALAPKIYPYLHLTDDRTYVEPFVGMGGVYLHARSQGWKGRVWLNDLNFAVSEFWRLVHRKFMFARLLEALMPYVDYERTNANYRRVAAEPLPTTPWGLVARWLWLQNAAGGGPPVSIANGCYRVEAPVCFDLHARRRAAGDLRGAKYDFEDVVKRVRALEPLTELPALVTNWEYPFPVAPGAVVYFDPPYAGRGGYNGRVSDVHLEHFVQQSPDTRVVISEQHPHGPQGTVVYEIGKRQGKMQDRAAVSEYLFVGGAE
jgi:site-specific DNA-adenine methylase